MRRIKLVLAALAVMVAMIAGSAMPAVADNNDNIFRFNDNRDNNNVFRFNDNRDLNDLNDLLNLGCLGAVIDFQCFGISTFDGFLFDNNGDFNNLNDFNDLNDNNGLFFGA